MKKYSMYTLVFCILLSGIFSLAIWNKRNDFSLSLRETTDYENTTVGDPNEIKDLEYQLTISDYNQYWTINGHGEEMTRAYHRRGDEPLKTIAELQEGKVGTYYRYVIEPVMNEKYIDQSKVKKASELGYTSTGNDDTYITDVSKVDYEFKIIDRNEKEIASYDFQVDVKNKQEPLKVYYGVSGYNGQKFYDVSDGDNSTYRKTYSRMDSSDTENLQTKEYSYFCVSPADFQFNTKNVKFSNPIGGIYRIDSKKDIKHIISADMDENIMYTMALYENQLYAIMGKKNDIYLQKYDMNGKFIKEQKLDIDTDLSEVKIEISNGMLLVNTKEAEDELTEKTFVLNTDDLSIQHNFTYPAKGFEKMCKYKDDKLTIVSGYSTNLYIRVFQEDKTLYDSEFFGDYQDDEKIVIPNGSSYSESPNFNPIYRLLYMNTRDIRVDWIK